MEIPGIGSNNLRLDPNRLINAPDVLPSKVPPQTKEQGEAVKQQTPTQKMPNQAPDTPVLTKNLQSFSNLLMEVGVPNTPQNGQLAQTLASYGQPVNKQTMTQVNNALGPLMNQGISNIEAGVVLMINNIPVNQGSVESVKQILTGGGLSQNMLVLNKELKKMVDGFGNKDFVKEISDKIQQNNSANNLNLENDSQQGSQLLIGQNKESPESINQQNQQLKKFDAKVDESGLVKKNPYAEEENNEEMPKQFKHEQSFSPKSTGLIAVNNENNIMQNNLNSKQVVEQLANRAEKIHQTLNTLLSIDVLKNPGNFPHQITMLKKAFADLEVDVKEFKELIERNFPELKSSSDSLDQDENIFTNLLKMVFGNEENEKTKKIKDHKALKGAMSFDSDLLKTLNDVAKSVSLNMSGRELLTKNLDCMCIPLSIPVNGKFYDVEIMINREDQSRRKAEIGQVPLKIQLAIETKNMGRVAVDINNLKRDLQIHLSVENKAIKDQVDMKVSNLQNTLKELPYDLKPIYCSVNPRPEQNPSILLPSKYKVMSMNRIEGIV